MNKIIHFYYHNKNINMKGLAKNMPGANINTSLHSITQKKNRNNLKIQNLNFKISG